MASPRLIALKVAAKCNDSEPSRPVFTSWVCHWLNVWLWVSYLNFLNLNEKWGKHNSMDICWFHATHEELPTLGETPTVPEWGTNSPCPCKLAAKAMWPKPATWCCQGNDTDTGSEHPCCRSSGSCRVLTTPFPWKPLGVSSAVSIPWWEPIFLLWFLNSLPLQFVSYLMTFQ